MRKKENKQRNANKLIFLTIATTIIAVAVSFAKYQSISVGSSTASVATPVITLSEGEAISLSISPSAENEYIFKVSNVDGGTISQVSMEYILKISTNSNLPFQFELYKCQQNGANYETTSSNLLSASGTATDEIELNLSSEEVTHLYKLVVGWNQDDLNYRYSQEIDYIQVILSSKQVD